jgi:hypothetical protein
MHQRFFNSQRDTARDVLIMHCIHTNYYFGVGDTKESSVLGLKFTSLEMVISNQDLQLLTQDLALIFKSLNTESIYLLRRRQKKKVVHKVKA